LRSVRDAIRFKRLAGYLYSLKSHTASPSLAAALPELGVFFAQMYALS